MQLWTTGGARLAWIAAWVLLMSVALYNGQQARGQGNWTVPLAPPLLLNPEFECEAGYSEGLTPIGQKTTVPDGWTVLYLNGSPSIGSTRLTYAASATTPPQDLSNGSANSTASWFARRTSKHYLHRESHLTSCYTSRCRRLLAEITA
jgi:hypothetical protein